MSGITHSFHHTLPSIRRFLEECRFFPGINTSRNQLLRLLEELEAGCEQAERPLRVLLTGGTGVGKSTLMNALAGDTIARTGEIRPTTSGFTAYHHHSDTDEWVRSLPDVQSVEHQRSELRDKIIIDAPDADSTARHHRELLENALRLVDLVIVVMTPEKYVSASVFNLLAKYRVGRNYAFVLNKMDRGSTEEVAADFRDVVRQNGFDGVRTFIISALNALPGAGHSDMSSGQFEELAGYLGEELDRVRIQEIRRLNIQDRSHLLGHRIIRELPEDYTGAATRWLAECETENARFVRDIERRLARILENDPALAESIVYSRASGIQGLFGFLSDVIFLVRRSFRRGPVIREADDVSSWLNKRVHRSDLSSLDELAGRLEERWITESRRHGLNSEAVAVDLSALNEGLSSRMMLWLQTELPRWVHDALQKWNQPLSRLGSACLNLPAWAWVTFWIYRIARALITNFPVPWEQLPGAAVALVFLLGLQWMIVNRWLQWQGRRRRKRVITDVSGRLETVLHEQMSAGLNRTKRHIDECSQQVEKALARLMPDPPGSDR